MARSVKSSSIRNEPISPLPESVEVNEHWLSLGRKLFHDKRLSANADVACVSCHDLSRGGADNKAVSQGMDLQSGNINTPTVLNSRYNFRQFWDGRAASLEQQIDGPMTSPFEMGGTWPDVLRKLKADKSYKQLFSQNFPDGVTKKNIKLVIAEYERSLITPNSPFDRYLRRDDTALSPQAIAGYQRFKALGCISCHQGINVGGNMFQHFGVMGDYFADRGNITEADYGRFNVTGLEEDRHKFKVPSLRNVALTAPYLHDGQAQTLEDAVRIMGKYQLGIELNDESVADLVAFLISLTGQMALISEQSAQEMAIDE
ncbi:MAG: cytochrome-c peroxidase [Pseudomonadales bacterium]|nr:cytochrome-c peroxidase [Pseudomonadales bacterium]